MRSVSALGEFSALFCVKPRSRRKQRARSATAERASRGAANTGRGCWTIDARHNDNTATTHPSTPRDSPKPQLPFQRVRRHHPRLPAPPTLVLLPIRIGTARSLSSRRGSTDAAASAAADVGCGGRQRASRVQGARAPARALSRPSQRQRAAEGVSHRQRARPQPPPIGGARGGQHGPRSLGRQEGDQGAQVCVSSLGVQDGPSSPSFCSL